MPSLILCISLAVTNLLDLASANNCKSTPGTTNWPSLSAWSALNTTLGGQLIQPVPPGAVCHPDQPTYNATTCSIVQTAWTTYTFEIENPVLVAHDNFNNDTCLPDPTAPCSAVGYPRFVVNATTATQVKAGVDFAREHDVRLIVKGTGHDAMGRSTAPNSLSIWTRHIRGLRFSSDYQLQSCNMTSSTSAVTISAGEILEDIYAAADALGLVIVGGQAYDVGIGGYITAGGHSHLSVLYGLAADQVLEATIVTPAGEIITANACQNSDYFYAFRGGGGSTFGVLIDVTVKTFPTPPITMLVIEILSAVADNAFFEQIAYVMTQYPYLSARNVSGYPYIYPLYATSATTYAAVYKADFLLHDGTSGKEFTAIFEPIMEYIKTTWPGTTLTNSTFEYPSFYSHFKVNADSSAAGTDGVTGSRLLPAEVLTGDFDTLVTAVKGFTGNLSTSGAAPFLLGGKGVTDVIPEGGSDAVLPAWRKSLVHFASSIQWEPLNMTARAVGEATMDAKIQFLRDLVPDSGAYVNEAYIMEPDWQETFWGTNYAKLLAIKKAVDPTDVFWCYPCVGSEGWKLVGDSLCRV